MTFDEAFDLVNSGHAVFSESLGLTMLNKRDEQTLIFVPRQHSKPQPRIAQSGMAVLAALASDWVLSGIDLSSEAA